MSSDSCLSASDGRAGCLKAFSQGSKQVKLIWNHVWLNMSLERNIRALIPSPLIKRLHHAYHQGEDIIKEGADFNILAAVLAVSCNILMLARLVSWTWLPCCCHVILDLNIIGALFSLWPFRVSGKGLAFIIICVQSGNKTWLVSEWLSLMPYSTQKVGGVSLGQVWLRMLFGLSVKRLLLSN